MSVTRTSGWSGSRRKLDDFNRKVFSPQIEGSKAALELPGIVDQVISMVLKSDDGTPYRAFVCQHINPWGYPAKDRSGRPEVVEEPHLGRLIVKITAPRAISRRVFMNSYSNNAAWNDFNDAEDQREYALIPPKTLAKVIMAIRPGGYDDPSQGWTGGYATRSDKTGAIYLNAKFTILEGPFAKRVCSG